MTKERRGRPTLPWPSQIRGSGMEAAAKVLDIIDGGGGIEAFDTPSKLRRFAGLAPVTELDIECELSPV